MTVVMKQPWVQNDHGYEMTIGTNYWYTSSKKSIFPNCSLYISYSTDKGSFLVNHELL